MNIYGNKVIRFRYLDLSKHHLETSISILNAFWSVLILFGETQNWVSATLSIHTWQLCATCYLN